MKIRKKSKFAYRKSSFARWAMIRKKKELKTYKNYSDEND